jgi:hypothetical protein
MIRTANEYKKIFGRKHTKESWKTWTNILLDDFETLEKTTDADAVETRRELEEEVRMLREYKEDRAFLEPKNLYDAEKWDIATLLYLLELKDLQAIFEQYKDKIK